jgi:hypothetical protein
MPNTTFVERAAANPLILVTDYNYPQAIKLVAEASSTVTSNEQCKSPNRRAD